MKNWLIKIKCKYFGHKMVRIWTDSLPSSTGPFSSLSVKEVWKCSRCEFTENKRARWD